jgi:hypothetical protein
MVMTTKVENAEYLSHNHNIYLSVPKDIIAKVLLKFF